MRYLLFILLFSLNMYAQDTNLSNDVKDKHNTSNSHIKSNMRHTENNKLSNSDSCHMNHDVREHHMREIHEVRITHITVQHLSAVTTTPSNIDYGYQGVRTAPTVNVYFVPKEQEVNNNASSDQGNESILPKNEFMNHCLSNDSDKEIQVCTCMYGDAINIMQTSRDIPGMMDANEALMYASRNRCEKIYDK